RQGLRPCPFGYSINVPGSECPLVRHFKRSGFSYFREARSVLSNSLMRYPDRSYLEVCSPTHGLPFQPGRSFFSRQKYWAKIFWPLKPLASALVASQATTAPDTSAGGAPSAVKPNLAMSWAMRSVEVNPGSTL